MDIKNSCSHDQVDFSATKVTESNHDFSATKLQIRNDGEQFKPSYSKQVLAAVIIYFGPISFGIVCGYSSPMVSDLDKPGRSFRLTLEEISLFASLMTLGALVGGLIAGPLVEYLGRKQCMFFLCVPYALGWLTIAYANHIMESYIVMLYVGRVTTGICTGIVSLCAPIYLSEIASPDIRGALGSGFALFANLGILLSYSVGAYVTWSYLAFIAAVIPLLLMLLIIPIPESPGWLIRQKRNSQAMDALVWLRGKNANVREEYDDLVKSAAQNTTFSIFDLRRPELLKPFVLIAMEMFFQQASGITAVVFNTSSILKASGDSLDSETGAIVVAAVMGFANFFSIYFADRAGRRILLIISAFCMALSNAVLGSYYYVQYIDPSKAESIGWLPVICLVVFVFTFNIGFGPLPWLMMSEVFPPEARGKASCIITALLWLFAFGVTKSFANLQEALNDHGVFWLFSGFCVLAVVFVWKFIPETKGKTLDEIQQAFKSKSNSNTIDNGTELPSSTRNNNCLNSHL